MPRRDRVQTYILSFVIISSILVACASVAFQLVASRQAEPEVPLPPPDFVQSSMNLDEPLPPQMRIPSEPMSNETLAKLMAALRSVPECCFVADDLGELPVMTQASAAASATMPVLISDWPVTPPPSTVRIIVMQRTDIGAAHLEFNVHVDRLARREDADSYNDSERIRYVTGVLLPGTQALSDYAFAPFTLGCAPWETTVTGYQTGVCAMAASTYFQARVSNAASVLTVHDGRVRVMLTRDSALSSLYLFPVIHPLRGQSQLAFHKFAEHGAFTAYPFTRGHRVPVHNVTLEAGQSLYLPPCWGHRIVALNNSVAAVAYAFEGALLKARGEAANLLPKLLTYGALHGQPFFVGMWALAVYVDALFGFKTAEERMGTRAEALAFARWGAAARVMRGHVDDPHAPAPYAKQVVANVRAECREMTTAPKDLMLHDRERFIEELREGADKVNALMLGVTDQVALDFKMNQAELAIAECLSVAAAADFFKCYFAGFKHALRQHL